MLKPKGYGSGTGPSWRGGRTESDMDCCIHCGQVNFVQAGFGPKSVLVYRADGTHYLREAGFCRRCMDHTCGRPQCLPCNGSRFRVMEIEETQARKLIL